MSGKESVVVAERPTTGTPRPYDFPHVERTTLPNGLRVAVAAMPGRQLISASLVVRHGAADEPDAIAGASVLAARAFTEGTESYDAIQLTEAAERLGASIHAEAGWDAGSISVDVPAARFDQALELLAEVARRPTFPEVEIERLRDERLNDILQAKADPRRRAEEAFVGTIYAASSPYRRPAGGTKDTVERLDRDAVLEMVAAAQDPARTTLIVGGEIDVDTVARAAERLFGDWQAQGATSTRTPDDTGAVETRFVKVVHRPGAVQTEIRVGHPGVPRRHPDFHAISVMSAILGGLFNSRLNMKLREEKGYTYGASAGFDMRRARGPFVARAAVNTDVTVAALTDALAELDRIRDAQVTESELRAARDFLIGVFPLRFETPGPVVGSLGGLFVHGLPDDELVHYRDRIEAVTIEDVQRVAREHIRPDGSAVVLVGDADAFAAELGALGLGEVVVERDEGPVAEGPIEEAVGPVDAGDEGPTVGAEEPQLPGSDEPTQGDDPTGSSDTAG
jgi:zinc protease